MFFIFHGEMEIQLFPHQSLALLLLHVSWVFLLLSFLGVVVFSRLSVWANPAPLSPQQLHCSYFCSFLLGFLSHKLMLLILEDSEDASQAVVDESLQVVAVASQAWSTVRWFCVFQILLRQLEADLSFPILED